MATAQQLIDTALTQRGKAYSEHPVTLLDDPDPASFDCSSLVQWAGAQIGLDPPLPRTSWLQLQHCADRGALIPLDQAARTAGALLFTNRDGNGGVMNPGTGRPFSGHSAISLGDGEHTIEAMGTKWGVATQTLSNRSFSHAGLVPGLDYAAAPTAPTPPGPELRPTAPAPVSAGGPTADESTWLVQGVMSDDVVVLQQRLRLVAAHILASGDALADYPATGDYGPLTDLAVRLFQHHARRHLDPAMDVDGKVGPSTWALLERLAQGG